MKKSPATCARCNGMGRARYTHGSTWRGGMGTNGSCYDICDQCWGSGNIEQPFRNLRVELALARYEKDKDIFYELARRCGAHHIKQETTELVRVLERESRRRKLPDGVDAFWYFRLVEGLAAALAKVSGTDS